MREEMGASDNSRLPLEPTVRILVENRLLRDSLARLVRKWMDFRVAAFSHVSELAKDTNPFSQRDVVLTDSLEKVVQLESLGNSHLQRFVKLVLFGMDVDPNVFLKAVHLGVCGYLLKEASGPEIVAAVGSAGRGEATCPPQLWMSLLQYLRTQTAQKLESSATFDAGQKALTMRQLQLIRLVAEGLTNKEIATNLNLSPFTVKNHLRRVMRQVEAITRHDAVHAVRATGQLAKNCL
jgi:DNA-binding NarL/FixJ family response regulator